MLYLQYHTDLYIVKLFINHSMHRFIQLHEFSALIYDERQIATLWPRKKYPAAFDNKDLAKLNVIYTEITLMHVTSCLLYPLT